jgi:hypothetical protein
MKALMQLRVVSYLFGATILLGGSACGKSPLLNHANAADSSSAGGLSVEAESAACPLSFSKSGLCASLTWTSGPSAETMNSFVLKFWKKTGADQNGPYSNPTQTVFVKLWMPSMGHGSSPVTLQHQQDATHTDLTGKFEASNVYFVMPGAWDLHVQLKDGTTVVEEAILAVKI